MSGKRNQPIEPDFENMEFEFLFKLEDDKVQIMSEVRPDPNDKNFHVCDVALPGLDQEIAEILKKQFPHVHRASGTIVRTWNKKGGEMQGEMQIKFVDLDEPAPRPIQ
jgi:hypothetical protein